ncbi:uncharacterized protein LOC130946840 isoform X1 [Arachis stenosperma]|uniref:uncharacterized protein LOC130946840 isoform X1 n=1 Tax=Arachis stenosperma TaxID=217475 RepID=UPI0025AC6B21|nr:uncharacterized protein LOC130946840 isoform X1 [Arachis stenosperma]
MSKVVVYLLIATAILGFIVFSPCNPNEEPNARLNRRLGFMLQDRAPHFDPLMVKIKTHPPRSLDNSSSVKDVADTYQYLTSAGRLNTTLRLIILFPLLDREPKDGAVSFNELQAWITQRAMERLDYVTQAELDSKDMDQDSALSFREYLPNFSQNDIEKREMGHGEAGWWMEKFNTADIDHNAVLNFTELRDFLHPEDSENQNMLKWLLRDRLKRIDDGTDGKLDFKEFEDHVYVTYESYMDFESNGTNVPNAKDKFSELDVNKDQFLSPEELIPILPYLYPGELAYARYYTYYLMNEADDNKDGKLSLEEMLDHEFIFYSTVHADGHSESDDEHDEL